MANRSPDPGPLLRPSQVAEMFRVTPATVTKWAKAGRLDYVRTLGGQRRFRESEALALRESQTSSRIAGQDQEG